jgi:hypothetical protein
LLAAAEHGSFADVLAGRLLHKRLSHKTAFLLLEALDAAITLQTEESQFVVELDEFMPLVRYNRTEILSTFEPYAILAILGGFLSQCSLPDSLRLEDRGLECSK